MTYIPKRIAEEVDELIEDKHMSFQDACTTVSELHEIRKCDVRIATVSIFDKYYKYWGPRRRVIKVREG